MAAAHLLSLYSATQTSRIKSIAALNLPLSIRRYSYKQQGKKESSGEERAPSTAEEFERVAEEKTRHAAEKAAADSESTFESGNKAHKDPPEKHHFHKTGHQP